MSQNDRPSFNRNSKSRPHKGAGRPPKSGGGRGGPGGGPGRGPRERGIPSRPPSFAVAKPRPDIEAQLRARRCAALAVMDVTANGTALELALAATPDYHGLEPRDRAFARAIAATTFRRMGQIDKVLKKYLQKSPGAYVKAVLRTATAQLLFLSTAAHAAVGETVNLLKTEKHTAGFSGLANAILRKVAAEGPALAATFAPSDNLPGWIRGSWERAYGRVPMRKIAAQLIKDPVLDISIKGERDAMLAKFTEASIDVTPIGARSLRLSSIGDITALPGFETGEWWAQDIAATLPVTVLEAQAGDLSGLRILDLCAAPGGKTLQLAARGAQVTAVDKSESRLKRLHENLARTNLTAEVICEDAMTYTSDTLFDAVLLDAPCSATGTFRRHPDVLHNRNEGDVSKLSRLQGRLLEKAAALTKPGGHLIYAVCSLQPEEGLARVVKFNDILPDFRLIPVSPIEPLDLPDARYADGGLRTLPFDLSTVGGMDGFFIAGFTRGAG